MMPSSAAVSGLLNFEGVRRMPRRSETSKESPIMNALRKLRESGNATIADYERLLAPNVVFHSRVLIRTAEGRDVVAKIFATSTTLREGGYTGEWRLDDRRTLLRWKGKIQGVTSWKALILSKKMTRGSS